MRPTSLVFPFRSDGAILLGRKKQGFGKGKWNGFGGKAYPGESMLECAVRELYEESGIRVQPDDLQEMGRLEFEFVNAPELNHPAFVYFVRNVTKVPVATKEMEPQWWSPFLIPYDHMWEADKYWLPDMLRGHQIQGRIVFAEDGESLLTHTLTEVDFFV